MKNFKFLMLIAFGFVLLQSCSNDDGPTVNPVEKSKMELVKTIKANNHVIEFYSSHKNFLVGNNSLEVMIKEDGSENYFSDIKVMDFMPMMHMTKMMHSCPKSETFSTKEGKAMGFVVFIMPSSEQEPWKLNFSYTVNGTSYKVENQIIEVKNPERAMLAKGKGKDGKKYFMAYIKPTSPKVGINEITTKVYTMESMKSFPEVENYKILLDPRMPGMGNHSSPNNKNLEYQKATKLYKGDVNFSMTGYWKLNLQLENTNGEIVLGNAIEKDKESSNLYWEIEF